MSFWNGVKQAFGFSTAHEDEEEEYASGLPVYAVSPAPVPVSAAQATSAAAREAEPRQLPADMADYIAEKVAERLAAKSDPVPAATASEETEKLRAENSKLRLSLDRQKRALLDRVNDLEAQVARLNKEKEKICLSRNKGADAERIAGLEADVAKAIGERDETAQLLSQLTEEMDRYKERQDKKIADLREKLSAATAENESLRSTIETNLYAHADAESKLRAEIADLHEQLRVANEAAEASIAAEPAAPSIGRKRGRPKKARIDADLDNPEWFSSASRKDDPDFGYHEPPRRPSNDSAEQLSLF